MMKIATVTWITYNNYGTMLQAYALQQQLYNYGIDNTILSDKAVLQEFKTEHPEKVKLEVSQKARHLSWKSRMSNLLDHPGRISRIFLARINRREYERPYSESQEKCKHFKKENLRIRFDIDPACLKDLNIEFDIFIAGSDQIWAVFDSIFNPYYYLNFVTQKKIAYAPSLATTIISEQRVDEIRLLLADFTAISVREKITADQLTNITGRKIEWVADPTLLHDKEFWSRFAEKKPIRKRKYLLCYFLQNKDWYFKYAEKLAKELHLKIVLLPNKWDYLSNEYVVREGIGPQEFVSMIEHADYVLTDSYHGCIFSLIFEKDFQYLLRFAEDDPDSQNIRIHSLFEFLGLNNRIVREGGNFLPSVQIDNYCEITEKLKSFRKHSQEYLRENLLDSLYED
ncbi:MAG: polysaccharide pyruvyl transferase family protein [Clostridia bacterium]|nr:polysaccharide pyruvyl transferase family protein [Clostridia bacterium]